MPGLLMSRDNAEPKAKQPLAASRALTLERLNPPRNLATETLKVERTRSDLVNQVYAMTPAEIALRC